MRNTIQKKLLSIIGEILGNINLPMNIDFTIPLNQEGLGLDSISRLTLLCKAESAFSLEIPERYWGNEPFSTLVELVDFIVKYKDKSL